MRSGEKFMGKQSIEEKLSEPEFELQFRQATRRGKQEVEKMPKASAVRFDPRSKRIVIEMKNRVTLLVPVELVQGLQTNDARELSDFELMLEGTQIHWHKLDVQFYIEDFLRGVFGTAKWMSDIREHLSEIGRKGGSANTAAKRLASVENGKRGGRPRKTKMA